jgi:hypothetical protein
VLFGHLRFSSAQFVGMGKNLCEGFAPAKELFSKASVILGYDLLEKVYMSKYYYQLVMLFAVHKWPKI